mmetsp:Transcript_17548/g.53975  ORF Transcript_17548/g.53975 Transcript_17548/m.53975 type:complete len:113 (-) Transcript_17548:264-602(-)
MTELPGSIKADREFDDAGEVVIRKLCWGKPDVADVLTGLCHCNKGLLRMRAYPASYGFCGSGNGDNGARSSDAGAKFKAEVLLIKSKSRPAWTNRWLGLKKDVDYDWKAFWE